MDGLKSKNARQRAECLDVMCSILEEYGISVCLPTPAVCMKEIAKQISDRDNSVRNAALNCVVQAFHLVGEKIYKMVGQISDKDMSLLEERIKRASKKPPAPKPTPRVEMDIPSMNQTLVLPRENAMNHDNDEMMDEEEEEECDELKLPDVVYGVYIFCCKLA